MFDCDVLEVSLISSASASETSVALKKRIAHPKHFALEAYARTIARLRGPITLPLLLSIVLVVVQKARDLLSQRRVVSRVAA